MIYDIFHIFVAAALFKMEGPPPGFTAPKMPRSLQHSFRVSVPEKKPLSRMLCSQVVPPLFSLSLRRSLIFSVITQGKRNGIQRLRT